MSHAQDRILGQVQGNVPGHTRDAFWVMHGATFRVIHGTAFWDMHGATFRVMPLGISSQWE